MKAILLRTWLTALATSICVLSCSKKEPEKSAQPNQPEAPPQPATEQEPPVYTTVPNFFFTDQERAYFGLNQLRGKVWVANFIFTRCPSTCPAQTAELAKLQSLLKGDPKKWEATRLLSITVDPEFDTPAVMAAYAKTHGADTSHWKFLSGARSKLWAFSKDGFKLPVTEDSENVQVPIVHSSRFVLVDRGGRIRGWYESSDEAGRAKLRADIDRVLLEEAPAGSEPYKVVAIETDVMDPPWLKPRGEAQIAAAGEIGVFHDFKFADRMFESGITFEHQIVEDAGKVHKLNHYDHGNGVAAADVDGDGRTDLYFSTQLGSNQLWRNAGGGKFVNITTPEITLADKIGVTASFADTDNDGDPDLFVTTVRGGNHFFTNDGKGKFTDQTEHSGLGYSGHSSGAVFFDYDRDGLLDLFVANVGVYTTEEQGVGGYYIGFRDGFAGHMKPERSERSTLYKNTGGNRFVDVSREVGLEEEGWNGDATPIDANDDGWIDLYIPSMQGDDSYYENIEGKRFSKKGRLFPKTPWGSMGVKLLDFENDGDMDIFITDMHSDMSDSIDPIPADEKEKSVIYWPEDFLGAKLGSHIYGNAFFRKDGSDNYVEVSEGIGAENYWPWGLSTGDLNADGFEDAFLASSMNYPFRYGVNSVLLNDGGEKFRDSEFVLGVEPRRDRRTAKPWFTLDADGADKDHPMVSHRSLTGKCEVWAAVGTRSSVIFDLDADGDLDIVTNEMNDRPMVLVSDLSSKRGVHWLGVKLTGTKSNRDGLGATVKVFAGPNTYTKVHDGKSGYLSQSVLPLYFGLGDATAVEKVEIQWPSGTAQTITAPDTNRTLGVKEPG